MSQNLSRCSDSLDSNRTHPCPQQIVFRLVLEYHPHRTFTYLQGVSRCLVHHSIRSRNGVFGKPGAIQEYSSLMKCGYLVLCASTFNNVLLPERKLWSPLLWTISRAGLCPVAPVPLYKRQPDGCDAGHRCSDYRPLRNASKRSSGRYRPGLPLGGVVLSRTSCFKARLASR